MRWIVLLSLLGCLAARADVTGRWSGSARFAEDGKSKEDPISMTLVQRGDAVSGSVRVGDKDWPIVEGRSEDGGRLRLKVKIPNDTIQFDLTAAGDRMTGKITSSKESDKSVVEVELTRKAPARPALDATGVWSGRLTGKGESMPISIEIRQTGDEVAGIATARGLNAPLVGEMDGAKLTLRGEAGSEKIRFALIVTPENMSGFAASEADGKEAVLDAELTRTAKAAGSSGGVSGQWMGTADVGERGTVNHYAIRFRLAVSGSVLTGSVVNEDGEEYPIQHGSVQGNRVEFEMEPKGAHVRFHLTLDGDRLTGDSVESQGGSETTIRITAVRRPE
jgi:hypothetical protein